MQAQSKQPPPGSMPAHGIKRGPATQSHAVLSVFDSLADMEQDQEESVVKSWSSGLDGLQESQLEKHEDEGLDVRHHDIIRSAYMWLSCVKVFSMVTAHPAVAVAWSCGAAARSARIHVIYSSGWLTKLAFSPLMHLMFVQQDCSLCTSQWALQLFVH